MKINFVTESPEQIWILRRWCLEWQKHLSNSKIGVKADPTADINFYVNYALFNEKTKHDVCYFTHREKHNKVLQDKFDSAAQECDWCIAQSKNTLKLLPEEKSTIIKPSVAGFFLKQSVVFGVVGRDYESKRKRFHWLEELKKIKGVVLKSTKDDPLPYEQMPKFYKAIDYLIVLSDNEGGPMPVTEALAMGVPVIAPDVGWCWEYPVLRYKTLDELLVLVKGLIVLDDEWENSAKELMEVFEKIVHEKK